MNTLDLTRTTAENNQLLELVEEITARLQAGEHCNVDEYAARYPEYAERLRDWMTVMSAMADLGHSLLVHKQRNDSVCSPPLHGEGLGEGSHDLRGSPASAVVRGSLDPAHPDSSIEHPASSTGILGDFRILREVGRGGMGVVYEAEQISLGRRVALKVLPFAAMLDRQQLARFKNEARAAATLDHRNIVAIYSVGAERGVHYYAMQLIEGQSLAQVIDQLRAGARAPSQSDGRPPARYEQQGASSDKVCSPPLHGEGLGEGCRDTIAAATLPTLHASDSSSLPAFSTRDYFRTIALLGIQAAEALDHAHQNGILHRDIKPANLLVECSHLAPRDDGHYAERDAHTHLKLWITDFGLARMEQDAGMTMTGDLLGTLRYMSPEQALAKRVVVDHRSDIYSLGVTLYELLTLEPAYAATDRQELLRHIAFDEPRKPRQINPRIAKDLETIILKSIEKEPADRYTTAQDLADDLQRFLDDRPVVARAPSLAHRARTWSRRNRPIVWAAVATLLVTSVVAAGGLGWIARDRAVRQALLAQEVDRTLKEATRLLAQGNLSEGNDWARRAAVLLAGVSTDDTIRNRLGAVRADLTMLAALEEIIIRQSEVQHEAFAFARSDLEYAKAFRDYGIDVDALQPATVAERIRASAIKDRLITALDDWVHTKRWMDLAAEKRLLTIAQLADDDPWRNRLRETLRDNWEELSELAVDMQFLDQHPSSVLLLAAALQGKENMPLAIEVLQKAQQRHPGDIWINHNLARCLTMSTPPQTSQAIGYYRAAVALRPESPGIQLNLGAALQELGDVDGAEAAYRRAILLKPDYASAFMNLGSVLETKGLHDDAIDARRTAVRLNANDPLFHEALGLALARNELFDEAIENYQQALLLDGKNASTHYNLGHARAKKGDWDAAIDSFRAAIALNKDYADAHGMLGLALMQIGLLDESINACEKAIDADPNIVESYNTLGIALRRKGEFEKAVATYKRALALKPDMAKFHINLGSAYLELKRFDKASAEYHRAADLDPKDSEGHYHVGLVHQMNDKLDEAIAAYSRAIELEPDHGSAHRNRAVALLKNGQAPLAINDFEVVVKLRLNNPVAHYELAKCLCTANRWDEAIEALLTATRLQSDYAEAHQLLGMAQYRAGDYKSSIKNLNKAVELRNGGDGLDWFVLAMVHWQLDRKDDARKWYDKAVGWMEKNAPTNKELLVLRAEATKLLGLPLTDKNQPRADFEVTPNSTKDNSQPTTDNQPRTMND